MARATDFAKPDTFFRSVELIRGQSDLKRKLVSVFSQYTAFLAGRSVGRPLALVYGPSSTGKTETVKRLAEASGLPFTHVSGQGLSPAGHKGQSLRELIGQHWSRYKTDEGIMFVDEVDKWCRTAVGNDSERVAWNMGLQAGLLTYLEGDVVELVDETDWESETPRHIVKTAQEKVEAEPPLFDTSRTLWILAGAFGKLDTMIRNRLHNYYLPDEEIWQEALPSDFIAYGMSTELVNRIQTWAWTVPLKTTDMIQILREQAVPQWDELFGTIGCEVSIDDGALGACVDMAEIEKTGARGAMSFLRRSMEDIFVEASLAGLTSVRVDVTVVRSGRLEGIEVAG